MLIAILLLAGLVCAIAKARKLAMLNPQRSWGAGKTIFGLLRGR